MLGNNGSFSQVTTLIGFESDPGDLPALLPTEVPKHPLWRKVRDMFKKRKKQNFFPRPAKAVKVKALPKCPDVIWPNWNEEKVRVAQITYKSPFESGYAFAHFLEKKGFKKLGSGSFSMVYAKGDSDKVLKICYRLDAWMDYISWAAKKGYCGTFAPRVYSYKYFKGTAEPFYVAVVERLDKEVGHIANDHPQAFTYRAFGWGYRDPKAFANDNYRKCLEILNPGMPQFVQDFVEWSKDHQPDMHQGNFMVRKDGSFVATDPIMGGGKTVTNRLRSNDFTLGPHFEAPLERLAA